MAGFCLSLALTACNQLQDQHAEYYVFGTRVEVSLRQTHEELASHAFGTLQQKFQFMHREWHAWEPGELTRINQAFSEGRKIRISVDMDTLIRQSQQLESASAGRFNPAIGGLIELWGFHTSNFPLLGPPPASEAILNRLSLHPSSLDVHFDGNQVSSINPHVQFDFGGIAKGYAVDIAIEYLRDMNVPAAIVNAGGDLRAFGAKTSDPWKIGISNPTGGVLGSIDINGDEAVFTSGNSHRYRENKEGVSQPVRYPHIINPTTGWPVSGLSSVTVVATEGLVADAAATALMVAGPADWLGVANALGIDTVLVVDEQGKIYMTGAMKARLTLKSDTEITVVERP